MNLKKKRFSCLILALFFAVALALCSVYSLSKARKTYAYTNPFQGSVFSVDFTYERLGTVLTATGQTPDYTEYGITFQTFYNAYNDHPSYGALNIIQIRVYFANPINVNVTPIFVYRPSGFQTSYDGFYYTNQINPDTNDYFTVPWSMTYYGSSTFDYLQPSRGFASASGFYVSMANGGRRLNGLEFYIPPPDALSELKGSITAGDFFRSSLNILDVKIFGVFSIADILIMVLGLSLTLAALKYFAGG